MTSLPLVGIHPIDWNLGNIASQWSEFHDYVIPTRMPIDDNPALKSTPRWTAVQQLDAGLAPRFACLDPSIPGRILGELQALLTDPGTFAIDGSALWNSDIPDTLATRLDYLPKEIGMAGQGYSGKPVTTDIRATISGVALIALRGIAVGFSLLLDKVSSGDSTLFNSWWNDWTLTCGEHVALVGQDHSFEVIHNMQDLQSGLVLDASSTQEGLPAVLVQLGRRMLSSNVRFALLFSTVAFRVVEIDCRSSQGHVLLVSPAFWLSSDPPKDPGMPLLESKPLPALLTTMVLAGLRHPVIHPVACDLEVLRSVLLRSTADDNMSTSGTEVSTSRSGVSGEQVLAFSYMTTGVLPTVRVLRRARMQPYEPGITRRPLISPLPNSSPSLPISREACPALGALPDPPGLPEPGHSLVLHEHITYAGCLEAWRGTLDQTTRVLAKLFLHEHVESAHREAYAYEHFLSTPQIEGVIVPRYWGTYTYRGEFYVIVLEDTGPKLKSFRECNPRQREIMMNYAQGLHNSGLGFPAAISHFTFTSTAEGDVRIVDFGDSFEHQCDPETCEELRKLLRLLDNVVPHPP